jgi:tetratricopeptide (TPR) repeat protein
VTFDTANPIYQELRARVLQAGARVVPFVGAGLSVYGGPEERLPLWRELIERLVAEGHSLGLIADEDDAAIDVALRSDLYIEAMARVLDALGEPTFKRVIERELDEAGKPTPPAIAELVGVGWSLIVTTNLDRLITRAYLERHGRPMDAFTSLDTHRLAAALAGTLASSETQLAQIHGAVDVYPSWRLTRSHYQQLLQEPGYVEALKQLFLRQVFFVGFGLQDDDLDLLLATVAEIYPAGVGEFYALISRSRMDDPVLQRLIRVNGLRPIFYDVDQEPDSHDAFGGHREVFECLEDLATGWAAGGRALEVTLKYFPELDPYVVGREPEVERLAALLAREPGCVVQVIGLGGVGKTSLVQRFLADKGPALASDGYRSAFGCSFYRADIGQFIQDMALATVGPLAVPLPQQVERICRYVWLHRTVLVLDGVEVLADDEQQVRNPYLQQIVDHVIGGRGAVIVTSRIAIHGAVFEHAPVIEVAALSDDQIVSFLDKWGLGGLGDTAKRRLVEITAGHPLALRILAGVLGTVSAQDALLTIERSAVIDISDEVDPLRENRLARVLGSYVHHLEDAELAFLTAATVFDEPAAYPLMAATLGRRYPDTAVNAHLVGLDLRAIIARLLERRLLTVSAVGELSSHPTVREYFARRARQGAEPLAPLHRQLATEYLHGTSSLPDNFIEAKPLLAVCRHAAACEDWTLFDEIFRRRLMRVENYLCNNLGAWEEALALARLGHESSFPSELTPEPAYYPATVARCLKHLGRSSESRSTYQEALIIAGQSRDSNTAKYVNNFLTLLISRGELARADMLVELNMRALAWTDERWKYCWQLDQGLASIAYMRMLQGDSAESLRLLNRAEQAWDDHPDGPMTLFSHYPYHRSELILLADPSGHDAALEAIGALLSIACDESWPESVCRGHIQAARVYLDRCECEHSRVDLVRADQHLREAQEIAAGMIVPDVEIRHLLTRVKRYLVHCSLDRTISSRHVELSDLIARAAARVEMSALDLAGSEVTAARGALAHLRGSPAEARGYYMQAIEQCRAQGNAHAGLSRRSLVYWLGSRLGHEPVPAPTWKTDPSGILGAGLTAKQMFDQLTVALAVECGDR